MLKDERVGPEKNKKKYLDSAKGQPLPFFKFKIKKFPRAVLQHHCWASNDENVRYDFLQNIDDEAPTLLFSRYSENDAIRIDTRYLIRYSNVCG